MLKPTRGYVLIGIEESPDQTDGGILLPESGKKFPITARVMALGAPRLLKNGQEAPDVVDVGQRIVYSTYNQVRVTVGHEEYAIIPDTDILAVITSEAAEVTKA